MYISDKKLDNKAGTSKAVYRKDEWGWNDRVSGFLLNSNYYLTRARGGNNASRVFMYDKFVSDEYCLDRDPGET